VSVTAFFGVWGQGPLGKKRPTSLASSRRGGGGEGGGCVQSGMQAGEGGPLWGCPCKFDQPIRKSASLRPTKSINSSSSSTNNNKKRRRSLCVHMNVEGGGSRPCLQEISTNNRRFGGKWAARWIQHTVVVPFDFRLDGSETPVIFLLLACFSSSSSYCWHAFFPLVM
jgi:hypothetical protein